jgi:hypothetical protein
MSDRTRFIILGFLLAASIALLLIAKHSLGRLGS